MSSLATHHYVVLPVHVILSREGGVTLVYPFAGRSMDAVCASLRAAGDKAQLVTQLAEMATAVILTLQKLQAQKSKVCWVSCMAGQKLRMLPGSVAWADLSVCALQHGSACYSGVRLCSWQIFVALQTQ